MTHPTARDALPDPETGACARSFSEPVADGSPKAGGVPYRDAHPPGRAAAWNTPGTGDVPVGEALDLTRPVDIRKL